MSNLNETPARNANPWARTGPLLAGALIALVSAGVQKVYSDHTLGSQVDALQLQLREHAVILAGPTGITIQLTEVRRALEVCRAAGTVSFADETPAAGPKHRLTTEAP